jgi:hypothetical protein
LLSQLYVRLVCYVRAMASIWRNVRVMQAVGLAAGTPGLSHVVFVPSVFSLGAMAPKAETGRICLILGALCNPDFVRTLWRPDLIRYHPFYPMHQDG